MMYYSIDIDTKLTPGHPLFPDNFGYPRGIREGWYGLPGYLETDLWLVSRRPKRGIPGYPRGVVRAPGYPGIDLWLVSSTPKPGIQGHPGGYSRVSGCLESHR